MITGQKGIVASKQARFQIVDIVASMKPLTKMTRQIVSAASIPATVRDAFRVAMEERPGPVHLELPEDVAAEEVEHAPVIPVHPIERPLAAPAALDRAAQAILAAKRPLVMIGAAGSRPWLTESLSTFVARTRLPFFNTQMGKGAVTGGSNLYLGTAALSEGDYVHEAVARAVRLAVERGCALDGWPTGKAEAQNLRRFVESFAHRIVDGGGQPVIVADTIDPQQLAMAAGHQQKQIGK